MNELNPDENLKALFDRQRAADHDRAPGFHAMRTRALAAGAGTPRSMPLAWRWALSGAAALGLAAILSLHHPAPAPTRSHDVVVREIDQIDAAVQRSLAAQHELTAWQSPTDFLLHPINIANTP